MRINRYDGLGLIALLLSAFLIWATINAWTDASLYGRGAGMVGAMAALGSGTLFLGIGRSRLAESVGEKVFMVGLAVFIVLIYVFIVIPLVGKHTGWW